MKLPIVYDSNDFLLTIEKTLDDYVELLKEFGVNDHIVSVINQRNSAIEKSF